MSVKLLTEHYLEFLRLKGGCTGSFESTLVKIPHCWKSHVTAHIECRKDATRTWIPTGFTPNTISPLSSVEGHNNRNGLAFLYSFCTVRYWAGKINEVHIRKIIFQYILLSGGLEILKLNILYFYFICTLQT